MADVTGTETIINVAPNAGLKTVSVQLPATTDNGDTVDVSLAALGATAILGIVGSTIQAGGIVAQEQPTTAVSGDTLTITVGGAATNEAKLYVIYLA